MPEFRSLLLAVAGITLLSAATEQLLPSGRTKQTVAFIMGLLLLLAVLAPIAGMLGRLSHDAGSSGMTPSSCAYRVGESGGGRHA